MAGFKKAVRENVWLKIGISGTSGSGKTYSALRVATGLAAKCGSEIAFISTEKSRTLYYADQFSYDVLELEEYMPEAYIDAINKAVTAGYKIIIIDSLSHGWQALNDMHQKMSGNSFQNWGKLKPRWQNLMRTILQCPANVFVLSRAKTEWSIEDKNGRSVPTKVGLGTEGDKQQDYEYTISFMLQQGTHVASVDNGGKDNTGLYDGRYEILTEKDGEKLYDWANSGAAPSPLSVETMKAAVEPVTEPVASTEDELKAIKKEIVTLCTALGGTKNETLMTTLKEYVPSGNPNALKDLTKAQELLARLQTLSN